MAQVLVCNKCRHRIPYDGEWPDECPNCGYSMSLPDGDAVVMPAYNSWKTKVTDKVFRDMEAASIVRAQQAASILGVPESEMSHLKITNLNDRRDAPIAAITSDATAAAQRLGMKNPGQAFGGMGGADFARAAQAEAPRAGINAHERIKRVMGL